MEKAAFLRQFRNLMQSTEQMEQFIDAGESMQMEEWPRDTEQDRQIYSMQWELVRSIALRNVNYIHAVAESPIEKIFMTSVAMMFWRNDPFSLLVPPPDGWDVIERALMNERKITEAAARAGKRPGDIGPELLSDRDYHDQLIYPLLYRDLDGMYATHFSMQVHPADIELPTELQISDAAREGIKRMRIDAFFFRPLDPTRRLVVECDGYQWHKENFTKDRKRDRALRRAGFEVLRFSGSEIHNDPVGVAVDLWDYLYEQWGSTSDAKSAANPPEQQENT